MRKKKAVVKRAFIKIITETKVENGKTITTTKKEQWSDSPKAANFNWQPIEKMFHAIDKALLEIARQVKEREE